MKLLLVDDEPMVLELLKERVLKVLPDAVISDFSNAKAALLYAREHSFDIAFLDINMRVIDGVTMAKELQALYPSINIIFCTGYTEYMQDALDMYCSGYLLKPVTEEKIQTAISNLRYPVEETEPDVCFFCFGNFEAYYKGKPILFKYKRTKELLAYLVDRNGVDCTTQELMAVLFEDDNKRSYYNRLRTDLIGNFNDLGIGDVIRVSQGNIGINRDLVKCDHFDYQDGKRSDYPTEYMSQYSFSEYTYPKIYN